MAVLTGNKSLLPYPFMAMNRGDVLNICGQQITHLKYIEEVRNPVMGTLKVQWRSHNGNEGHVVFDDDLPSEQELNDRITAFLVALRMSE